MTQEERWKSRTRNSDVDEKGTRVIGSSAHGASHWTRTAEIQTEQCNSVQQSFFIKVRATNLDASGRGRWSSKQNHISSVTALHQTLSKVTPAPIAWGTYASDADIHFLLGLFVDVIDELPDIQTFTAKVAELHTNNTNILVRCIHVATNLRCSPICHVIIRKNRYPLSID